MLPNIYVKWTNYSFYFVTFPCCVVNTRVCGSDIMITFRLKPKYFVKNCFPAN